ncbi:protein IQ-DOMAIN 14-like [Glycine soja]|uniref:Protein IQ-DOMAIN 14 n=1 Tax=Glycine soja TaxID=3848 RepID=A0A0B2Q1Q1_GLYSO|nr:protein IQ-DOMAIN 14-like [Glycine soja]KHN13712.1 Protein IQ-DOMAIN 14 [Glycine soja]RZB80549.1 Protein IQ-DOMAIN 14 [Glycine soja]
MVKKGWFSMFKKLFLWNTHSSQEKKEKRRRAWIFGRVKTKRLPSITAPPPPPSKETRLSEAEEEHSKHALTVAIASAAAAEAAITAAQVAVEVVRLQSAAHLQLKEKQEQLQLQPFKTSHDAPQNTHQRQRKIQESSAIKIQTAYRGYLARKALRALKGIVKLQAIIRGRAVRRQALSTLKCLESIVSIQSQVFARKSQMVEERWDCGEHEEMQGSRDKIIRMDSNSERTWDDSILLKEEVDASCVSKKEAVLKREKVKEYSFNHRRSAESERNKINGRWRYWMEQWVDTQLSKSKELEDLDSVFSSHYSRPGEECGRRQLKLRNFQRQNQIEALDSPSLSSRNQTSGAEDHSVPSSPAIPTYMAATKSTQAKARSTSSPRARIGGNFDINSDSYSPCKNKLPIVTSINGEVLSNGRIGKLSSNQQRSPSLKGLPRPLKLSQTLRGLSINSDCPVPI